MQARISDSIWYSKADLRELPFLRATLTVRSKFGGDPIEIFNETSEEFGVPRYFKIPDKCLSPNINLEWSDCRALGTPTALKFVGTPRDYQEPVLAEMQESYFAHKRDSCILNLETGAGKTCLAIHTICTLGTTALVIVPKSDLIEQWRDALLEFTSIQPNEIGTVQQDTCEYEGKKVVIGMVHSICKDKYPQAFKDYFGLLVIDECHRSAAPTFSQICKMFPAKYRLGVSATVARQDGLDIIFRLHLGRTEIKLQGSTQPIPKVLVFKYAGFSGMVPKYLRDVTHKKAGLMTLLAENQDRNEKIAHMAFQLANGGRQTAILSERKKMLGGIRKVLIETYHMPPKKVGVYISATPKTEKARIVKECDIILATTKMLNEGTDIPTLRALILATPLTDPTQPAGRIRRRLEGVKEPIIIDILDTKYPESKRWYKSREKWYREKNCEINIL